MARKALIPAVAYLRTSSAANVGDDKDSHRRQLEAIQRFAKRAGYEILDTYYDAAVRGADPIDTRPGFATMIERLLSNGVRTIIVETANRFARDLIVQETGYAMMRARGLDLIAADKPDSFLDDTPTAVLIRQVLGAVSQFDKAMTVNKLKGARDRKSRDLGERIEGRKGVVEKYPKATERAKYWSRYHRLSLREISTRLAHEGYLAAEVKPVEGIRSGRPPRPFSAEVVRAMIGA